MERIKTRYMVHKLQMAPAVRKNYMADLYTAALCQ